MAKIEKLKDVFWYFLGIIILIYCVYMTFYENEKWHIVIYTLIIYNISVMIFYVLRRVRINLFDYLFYLFVCYLLILGLFSASPLLQKIEFEQTHPQWIQVERIQILDAKTHHFNKARKLAYSYMDLRFQFVIDHQKIVKTQRGMHKLYKIGLFESSEKLHKLLNIELQQALEQQTYSVFIHPENPHQFKIFLNQDLFNLRLSGFAWILFFMQATILTIFAVLFYVIVHEYLKSIFSKK